MEFHPALKKQQRTGMGMDQNRILDHCDRLAQRYDEEHGHGATLNLKDELGLGSGRFNEELSTDEVRKLDQELAARLDH